MASTINASTSSGLVNTADTSGILQLQTASTAAVTITAGQLVGIGTASPATKLEMGSGTLRIKNASGDSNGLQIYQDTSDVSRIYNFYSGPLAFGTNNTERMRIDSSGYVTKTYQPAFFAWFNNSGSNYSWANNAGAFTIIFDVATGSGPAFNTSSSYNAANGKFTAPIAGRYFFTTNLCVYTADGVYISDCGVGFRKNGSSNFFITEQQIADTAATTSNFQNWCFSTVFDLAASDTVEVYVTPFGTSYANGNGNLGSGTRTNFSGYLLG